MGAWVLGHGVWVLDSLTSITSHFHHLHQHLVAAADPKIFGGFRYPLLIGIVALAVSWLLTPWVRSLAISRGAMDDPKRDDRRIHKEPLPRWGGLAIYAGIVVALGIILPFAFPGSVVYPRYLLGMVIVGGALVIVGALDDLYQYSAKIQLLLLLTAGIGVQFFAGDLGQVQIKTLGIPFSDGHYVFLGAAALPVTAVYIFVVTKTMDTIDGVDGLAAGIATISAATLTIIGVYGEQPRVAMIAAAIAGAALGFMLACLSIVGALKTAAAVAILIPVFVFGVPLFDAVQVVIRRKLSGSPITEADKRHVHHTLLGKGLSQRQTVWVLYVVAALMCGLLLLIIQRNV